MKGHVYEKTLKVCRPIGCCTHSRGSDRGYSISSTANCDSGTEQYNGCQYHDPIQHLVVIFDENVSFDHYFGTYPNAQNPSGEPSFTARPNTPSVNGLTGALLTNNPNTANPQRLDRSQAQTCDQDHRYLDEQKAFDHGLMDQFIQTVSGGSCTNKSIVMDYFDGNTVTALWN